MCDTDAAENYTDYRIIEGKQSIWQVKKSWM